MVMKRIQGYVEGVFGLEKPSETKPEKTEQEKRIEEMEVCGQKLVDQIWNETRFSLVSDLKAKVELVRIMARYLRGNGLEQYVNEVAQPIDQALSQDPYYQGAQAVEIARLKMDLALNLEQAGRPCKVDLPRSISSFSPQDLLLVEHAVARARSADAVIKSFNAISGEKWTKQKLCQALLRYPYGLDGVNTRLIVGKEKGLIVRFVELEQRLKDQLNDGVLNIEECCELAEFLDEHDLFDRLIFHLMASMMLEYGVSRTLAMSDNGRSLREPFHRAGFMKCLPFVRVLAEGGGFAELLSLRNEEPWCDIYRAHPASFYDPILIELAKGEARRSVVPSEAVGSRGAFRTNTHAPHAIDTVEYWLDLWQREAEAEAARLPTSSADSQRKNQQFFLAQTFARMALSVPAKYAAAYLDQAEVCRERLMSMTDVDFVDTQGADIHMSSLTSLLNQARAYVRPESLDLASIQPTSLQKSEKLVVFETGLLLLRQAKKMRLALEKTKA
ncbi:hypothetical protein KBD34_05235 [Patescibacteria group bacterium]|nr:hypothetical protein [Patescibacteria group bacterium]